MQPWKTVSRQTLLTHSQYLTVENHVIELPDGQIISDWPWVVTPDYVNVVAVTTEGMFLCFRQTKYAVEGETLAIVGGYIELDEVPLVAAQRELLEETGYKASKWINLGSYAVDSNRGAGTAHLFLALEASHITEINADDLEEQELLFLTRAEVESALATHKFKVLAWTTALALALVNKKP